MTGNFIQVEKYEHWYTPKGLPFFEIEQEQKEIIEYFWPDGSHCEKVTGKNGKERKPRKTDIKTFNLVPNIIQPEPILRPVKVTDARQLGLLPSVTNILGVYNKPWMINYVLKHIYQAIENVPWPEGMPQQEWATLVKFQSEEHRRESSRTGFIIHDLLNQIHLTLGNGQTVEEFKGDNFYPYVENWVNWLLDQNFKIINAEKTIVSPLGYAGTIDLIAEINGKVYVIDFKTTEKGPDEYFSRKSEHFLQISAYANAYKAENAMIVQIDSHPETRGQLKHYEVLPDEIETYLNRFLNIFEVWIDSNKYNPLTHPSVIEALNGGQQNGSN